MVSCLQLSVRTSSVLICCTYLVFHAAFLVINFIIISDIDTHLQQIATHLDDVQDVGEGYSVRTQVSTCLSRI